MTKLLSRTVSFLFPLQGTVGHREKLLSGLGGVLAIALTAWICQLTIGTAAIPYLIAPMGASTVLLLGAPHSPLAQPWAFVGGHVVSALVGITCAKLVPGAFVSAGLAVGLAISAMYYLRCLHPPGGATALLGVMGGDSIRALGYGFMVTPLLLNIAALLGLALLLNWLLRRPYPHRLSLPGKSGVQPPAGRPPVKLAFDEDDLVAALKDMGGYIDVTGEDLERIYALALLHAHRGRLSEIRLKDIMTRQVVSIRPDTSQEAVWSLLRQNRIRGVPVTDEHGHLLGMLTIADFLKARDWRMCDSIRQRIKLMLKREPAGIAERIMTTPVISAKADTQLVEAFLIFAGQGINHLPVTDAENRVLGIVTRLDLLSSLYGDIAKAAPAESAKA